MNEKLIQTLAGELNDAEKDLLEANKLLGECAQQWSQIDDDSIKDADGCRVLQLALQYRLDTQSIFKELSKIQGSLLQLLGIEHLQSLEFNLDRMALALGSDDLQHILSMLNRLADALLHIINCTMRHQSLDRKASLERSKKGKYVDLVMKAIDKQKNCLVKITKLSQSFEDIDLQAQLDVVYDYISALQGPISRFFQALQNGLVLAGSFYQQLQNTTGLDLHLMDTLQRVDQALHQLNHQPQAQRLFTPVQQVSPQRLEERASEKRLGNFFNH